MTWFNRQPASLLLPSLSIFIIPKHGREQFIALPLRLLRSNVFRLLIIMLTSSSRLFSYSMLLLFLRQNRSELTLCPLEKVVFILVDSCSVREYSLLLWLLTYSSRFVLGYHFLPHFKMAYFRMTNTQHADFIYSSYFITFGFFPVSTILLFILDYFIRKTFCNRSVITSILLHLSCVFCFYAPSLPYLTLLQRHQHHRPQRHHIYTS